MRREFDEISKARERERETIERETKEFSEIPGIAVLRDMPHFIHHDDDNDAIFAHEFHTSQVLKIKFHFIEVLFAVDFCLMIRRVRCVGFFFLSLRRVFGS